MTTENFRPAFGDYHLLDHISYDCFLERNGAVECWGYSNKQQTKNSAISRCRYTQIKFTHLNFFSGFCLSISYIFFFASPFSLYFSNSLKSIKLKNVCIFFIDGSVVNMWSCIHCTQHDTTRHTRWEFQKERERESKKGRCYQLHAHVRFNLKVFNLERLFNPIVPLSSCSLFWLSLKIRRLNGKRWKKNVKKIENSKIRGKRTLI